VTTAQAPRRELPTLVSRRRHKTASVGPPHAAGPAIRHITTTAVSGQGMDAVAAAMSQLWQMPQGALDQ
jgi:hypothetical protein